MKRLLHVVLGILWLAFAGSAANAAETVGALMPTKGVAAYLSAYKSLEVELGDQAEVLLQRPAPDKMAWTNAVRKLTTLNARVIVAFGASTTLVAADEADKTPVVYCMAYDVEAIAAHGGAITGVSGKIPIAGLVKNMKRISSFTKLGVVFSSDETETSKEMEDAAAIGSQLGCEIVRSDVAGKGDNFDLPAADAVLFTTASAPMKEDNLLRLVDQARAGKVLTASLLAGTAERGIVLSLAANPRHQGREAARMVAAILKGADPKTIPPASSPKIEMTINLREAMHLGFNIPFELLGTARVIR